MATWTECNPNNCKSSYEFVYLLCIDVTSDQWGCIAGLYWCSKALISKFVYLNSIEVISKVVYTACIKVTIN
jgi:hypothetical protein